MPEADPPSPASANPAVDRCWSAWKRVYNAELANGKTTGSASMRADEAYRNAMPPLSGYENIRDFIACTAHALIIGAVREDQGSKLLYAAQVALGALSRQPPLPKPTA